MALLPFISLKKPKERSVLAGLCIQLLHGCLAGRRLCTAESAQRRTSRSGAVPAQKGSAEAAERSAEHAE